MKQEHKDYIIKNNINSVEELKTHLQHLSDYKHTLTKDGERMFRELSCLLYEDRESVLYFFVAKNKIDVVSKAREIIDNVRIPQGSNGKFTYNFSWRPNQKTESALNTKPVHSNPFVDEDYCTRKERVKDVEREEAESFGLGFLGSQMKRGKIINYNSPLTPKQKDKVTTGDLRQKEVNCQYTMCGDKKCICCYPNKSSELFKKLEVKDCTIKDGKVNVGVKESQTVKKAPIFTYCKQMKNALEQLAFRSEYGHNKYLEYDADYNNFARVPNGDEEYGNAMFRHALNIGEDSELDHYVAQAWDAVARLEIYLRNEKLKNS